MAKFNADSIEGLGKNKKKEFNDALKNKGIDSFEDLMDLINGDEDSGGGRSRHGGFNRKSDTFQDVFRWRENQKEAKELLAVLDQIEQQGVEGVSKEQLERIHEYGDTVEEARRNLKDTKFDNNFGSRLTQYNKLAKGIGSSLSNMYDTMKNIVEPWAKVNDAASKYAKSVAMSAVGMKALTDRTIDNVVNKKIGINYNISTDELIKAQQQYVQTVGRSLSIDDYQQESLGAMTSIMGERAAELAAAFENFGVNLNTTAEHSGKLFDKASKTGVSFEKLTDNVAKNIKIAQNYTFKNGLKGLESMAAKAVALKMDMAQVAALAEKVGSVEGSIDVASRLQVLGGPFAAMADPLGMMSEGLTDMEGLMDRVTKMIGGLGSFNRETGEVEVSAFNKKRIAAAASAMGISYDTMMESVNAQAKRGEIAKQIGASANANNLSDDMKELLKNTATFDKNGKAGVSINGEFKSIDELTDADYKTLVKETQSESDDIKDIARILRSHFDIVEGADKQKDANQADMVTSVGEGLTRIIDSVGHSNFWLKVIAGAQIAGQAVGMVSDVFDIVRTFRGGRGRGRGLKNMFRKRAPKLSSKIAKGKRTLGRTGVGRKFRKARIGKYKISKGIRGKAFKASSKINAKTGGRLGRILGKANLKEANVLGKFGGKFGQNVGKFGNIGGKFGEVVGKFGNIGGKFGQTVGKLSTGLSSKLGGVAMSGVQKIGGLGASLAGRSGIAGGVGRAMFNTALNAEGKLAGQLGLNAGKIATTGGATAAKAAGTAAGSAAGAGAGTAGSVAGTAAGALKNVGVGLAFGIASAGVEIGRDALERKGKIKKGGAMSTYMTITAEQAKWAGIGMMGGWWGAAIGAAVGTVTGIVKAVKRKREAKLDQKLERYGVQRKGDYGARSYKLIDKALDTGKISNRMRKKLEKKGDYELLAKIDEIKKQKEEEEESKKDREAQRQALINGGGGDVKKNIRKATFKVEKAYFGGKAFGANGGFGEETIPGQELLEKLPGGKLLTALMPKFGPANGIGQLIDKLKEKNAEKELDPEKKEKLRNASKNVGLAAASVAAFGPLGLAAFGTAKLIKRIRDKKKAEGEENGVEIKGKPEKGESPEAKEMNRKAEERASEEKKREDEKRKAEEEQRNLGGKLDVNITGTIKLEANGKQFNMDELMKDNIFKQELAKIISEQIKKNTTQTNVVERK